MPKHHIAKRTNGRDDNRALCGVEIPAGHSPWTTTLETCERCARIQRAHAEREAKPQPKPVPVVERAPNGFDEEDEESRRADAEIRKMTPPTAGRPAVKRTRIVVAEQMHLGAAPWHEHMNEAQLAAIDHTDGPCVLFAGAGSGKTRALVHRIARMVLQDGINGEGILAVTFSKKAADEMNARLKQLGVTTARVGTWHSLCLQILKEDKTEAGAWAIDDRDRAKSMLKEVLGYRHLDWKGSDLGAIRRFIGTCKANLWTWSSPEAKDLAKTTFGWESSKALDAFAMSQRMIESAGLLTFDDFLVMAHKHLASSESVRARWAGKWSHLLQDEAQDANVAQITIAEMLARDHRNYLAVGDPAQCHPPGVMIEVAVGREVPIESLATGDEIRSWNRNAQKMIGGRSIKVARRPYSGPIWTMHIPAVGLVPMTANHRVLARWTDRTSDVCVTYLMWRSDRGYRVGWCKLFSQSGGANNFHLAQRARLEKAHSVWILKVTSSRTDASVYESIIAAKYGIPTATFEPVDHMHQTEVCIARIFSEMSKPGPYANDEYAYEDTNRERGEKVLEDHHRDFNCPLYPWPGAEENAPQGRRTYFEVFASNIEPGLMSVPLSTRTNTWVVVGAVTHSHHHGMVYSLDVEEDHSYSANGVVVLNSIYAFRGSSPASLLAFESVWGAKRVAMMANYRSARTVVAAANAVIRSAAVRLPEEMTAMRDYEGSATALKCEDHDDEARCFVQWVTAHQQEGGSLSDCTSLYRTNAQSRALEDALLRAKVPYVIVGGVSFYERKEVKDLLAYLRVALGRDRDGDAVRRCINAPFRFLGKVFVERVMSLAKDCSDEVPDWGSIAMEAATQTGVQRRQQQSVVAWSDLLTEVVDMATRKTVGEDGDDSHNGPAMVLNHIVSTTDYIAAVEKDEGAESVESSTAANVRELIRVAFGFKSCDSLLDYIEETLKAAERKRRDEQAGGERVLLMSIHRSKGLEWPKVWVVGMNELVLPHAKGDIEEERRLAYVAMTRARDELVCSWVKTMALRSGVSVASPSRFLVDAGLM